MSEEQFEEKRRIFLRNLRDLVQASGKMQIEIAESIGVSKALFNMWMMGKAMPRMGKMQALADYFGITLTDLLEEKKDRPAYYANKDSQKAAQFLFDRPEYKVLFDACADVKPEDIDFVAQMIKRVTAYQEGFEKIKKEEE